MVTLLALLAFHDRTIVFVNPSNVSDAKEPQIAIENDGHIYIAYGAGDAVYVAVSKDSGASFASRLVSDTGKLSLGMRRGPRITAYKGVVTISAVYGEKGKGQDGDLVAFKSTDQGLTWSKPVKVNDIEGAACEGLHAMAVADDGTIACTWLDLRSKGTKLFMSTSRDGGTTWDKNLLVYESPSGSICECCHPSLMFDRRGALNIMFRNSINGARDMYLTSTKDNGETFAPAVKLGTGTWMLSACPMDGGMLAIDGEDRVRTVWRRNDQVYLDAPGIEESSMSTGKQPWVATGTKGLYTVLAGNQGIIEIRPQSNPSILYPRGTDPVVASSPDHKIVIAAWTDGRIFSARLAP